MDQVRTPRELFAAFQEYAIRKDGAAFGDLFAEDATLEFPFTPEGNPLRFVGREAIGKHTSEAWGQSPLRPEAFRLIATPQGDTDVLVAEYEVRGKNMATGRPFAIGAIIVLRTHQGRIVSMHEYLDPVALRQAGVPPRSEVPTPRDVLRLYYNAMQAKSADELADLYAADAIHEFSFFTPNRPPRLEGREAVRSAYRDGWRDHPLTINAIDDLFVCEATDPEVVIGQWRARAILKSSEKAVEITGLLVLRVRDGLIVHTRDFMDGLGIANALGRLPFTAEHRSTNE